MSGPFEEVFVQQVKLKKPKPTQKPVPVEPIMDVPDFGMVTVKLVDDVVAQPKPEKPEKIEDIADIAEKVPEEGAAIIAIEDRSTESLTLHDEIAVYQGSLYLWVILWMFAIMGATQLVKRNLEYPLRKKRPPFKIPFLGWPVGGMSREGWEWFVRIQPAIWCWPTTLYFGPTALEAMGYEFTAFQSLMFAPGAAGMSLGIWAMLPKSVKKWLNGVKPGSTADDVERLRSMLDELSDAEIREQLRAVTEEHSVVEDEPEAPG